jgi:hypothetical protein
MLRLVAPVTVQESSELEPAVIEDGFGAKAEMFGLGSTDTVMVTEAVVEPTAFVAVRV